MAGHSKWSNIKRKKEINDAKRSKIFTKLAKEITVAARNGSPDPTLNLRLRLAIQNAKGANMTKEAILRAIHKGNKMDSSVYEEVNYEGVGPHGVAIMVTCMTDKVIRTVANVRTIFTKYGGSLEKSGSISFLFDHKAVFIIPLGVIKQEDDFVLALIDAGAETVEKGEETMYTTCSVAHFGRVQQQLEATAVTPVYCGLQYIPHTFVEVNNEALVKLNKLVRALKEEEDVQQVYHNIALKEEQREVWEQDDLWFS
ncbi:YebC/PmpR family DNA-binding transcriptional regulator [Candidatus Cardinium hertigii]|uniref:Probable transcriptional regulatory protein DK880_00982 n=1 Tax=Candidatus Cardinium hertigii TaxID=247481 RepID=A0A2Z3LAC6_9BACT|nr:YebC/PmpR family DNA-binding transcriptional regulator [Candidatus Cardinium hertigii]AWN82279.1 putative transcriptional regulatory protein [Candidatus Cardinium hertigii]